MEENFSSINSAKSHLKLDYKYKTEFQSEIRIRMGKSSISLPDDVILKIKYSKII